MIRKKYHNNEIENQTCRKNLWNDNNVTSENCGCLLNVLKAEYDLAWL